MSPSPLTPVSQAVLAPLTSTAIFLVATVHDGSEQPVRDVLANLPAMTRSVGFRVPDARLAVVCGIGSECWDRLFSGPRPKELHRFQPVVGAKHSAPSTPGDLLFHIRAEQMDVCFEMARVITSAFGEHLSVIDEVHGFKFFEMRDLLGFVDGSENPTGLAAATAVTVGDEDAAFRGSSYVIVQKYLHDLSSWNALTVEEQELAVGRTKLENAELSDEQKPSNSHIALNVIEGPDGHELQILRDNMPFGSVGQAEYGTYFIGYSATPSITETMLERMFIGDPPGNHDRLLDFSVAKTGSLYFVPTADFLEDLPELP